MNSAANIHLDLTAEQLDVVKTILAKHAPSLEIWAIGSRVKGSARATSDLDLVLRNSKNLETPLELSVLAQLENAFEESSLPFLVDLIDWATASKNFQMLIEQQYIPIIAPPPD